MAPAGTSAPAQLNRAYLAWTVVCLVWGTTYLGIRVALETMPPFLMGGYRWLIAGSLMLTLLKARGETIPPPRAWGSLAVLGLLLIGLGNGGVVWAEQVVPSGLAAVLVASSPFWIVGIEQLRADREPVTARTALGLAVGFLGIVVLVWPEIDWSGAGRRFFLGVVATQVACFGWAVGSSYSRRRARAENVFGAAAIEMLFAGLALVAVGVLTGEPPRVTFSARSAVAFVYLILAGSIGAFSAYHYALKHLPVSTVSLYAYVNPVIAVMLGTIVLGEPFSSRIVVAAGFVLVGMALVRGRGSRR